MTKPYLLISDLHCHGWSAFAPRNDRVDHNSRLEIILQELLRAADVLGEAGGNEIVIAGDLFHVRGQIDPEVFNPVHKWLEYLCINGFCITAIPGNHDLKSKETTELGNAMQSLGAIDHFDVVTTPSFHANPGRAFIPWCSTKAGLVEALEVVKGKIRAMKGFKVHDTDLIIHAGINGVIMGMPDHGLDAEEVASWGFRRVFAGHYHNHKAFCDDKVISIGATTHQTWSDVGTKAGFLLVYPDRFEYRASHAPAFVELSGETEEEEIPLIVDGNYVRIRDVQRSDAEINALREEIMELGALGFSYQGTRAVVSARSGPAPKAVSLEASVGEYIKSLELEDKVLERVAAGSEDILSSVRTGKLAEAA